MALREFVHRRDDLVSQFLEQLEGGVYDEQRIKEQGGQRSGLAASAGFGPARLSAERGKEGSVEAELTMRQTPASRFNRLYDLLHGDDSIQQLSALDDAIWQQIQRNEVIEVDAVLSLVPGVLDLHQAAGVAALGPLVELMQSLPDEMLPDNFSRREAEQMTSQMPAVQEFANHMSTGPVPCTFVPVGDRRYTFFAELERNDILVELPELEGEVTVLAKIQRKVAKGKPETVGRPLPGMPRNREARRQATRPEPLTTRLQYPAAVVTVVGIYR